MGIRNKNGNWRKRAMYVKYIFPSISIEPIINDSVTAVYEPKVYMWKVHDVDETYI